MSKLMPKLTSRAVLQANLLAAASLALTATAHGGLTYIGRAVIPGGASNTSSDLSGLPHTKLEDGITYQDGFDGFGSGMAYTGIANRFVLLNDRGPNKNPNLVDNSVDNTTSYATRFQVADITLTGSGNNYAVNVGLAYTSLLKNETGTGYIGISNQFTGADATANRRLDPEGIAVAPDGSVYISDEYGPSIYKFGQTGTRQAVVPVPAKFRIANPFKTVAAEISGNTSGRVGNKGMEGLAITPNGLTMIGAMQSPLLQDAPTSGVNSTGTNVRFLSYNLASPGTAPKEFVYPLDSAVNLVSEITPINNHQFLVDERDAAGGTSLGVKKLYLIDINQAATPTDVAGTPQLSTTGATPGVTSLTKTLFADVGSLLRAAPGALSGGKLPDKFEGYAFGPDLADGRHVLFATNDNDYSDPNSATTYNNYIFAFAISDADLATFGVTEFARAALNPGITFVPEPTTLGALALTAVLLRRRR